MSFVTETEVLEHVPEFAGQSASDKARLLSQVDAYLRSRNVKGYLESSLVPEPLKLASYEIIRGILAGKLYQGKAATVVSKTVSAQSGTSVSKTFAAGSEDLNTYEQYILDLIKPYTKRSSVQFLKRF